MFPLLFPLPPPPSCTHAAQATGNGAADSDEDDEAPPKPRPAKRKKAAARSDDDEAPTKRPLTGFAAPGPISEELAAAVGKPMMSRGELAKWLAAYTNEHNLKVGWEHAGCGKGGDALVMRVELSEKRVCVWGGGVVAMAVVDGDVRKN